MQTTLQFAVGLTKQLSYKVINKVITLRKLSNNNKGLFAPVNTSALALSMEVKTSQFRYTLLARADGAQREGEQHVWSQPEWRSCEEGQVWPSRGLLRIFPLDGQLIKTEESHLPFPYQSPLTTSREHCGSILRPIKPPSYIQ